MAQQEDPNPDAQLEKSAPFLFMRKEPLDENERMKLNEEVKSMKTTFLAIHQMWEAMSNVFSQKEEISLARQTEKKQADSSSVAPVRSEDLTTPGIHIDEVTAKTYYEMWSNDLKQNIQQQRLKERQSIEKWFKYLHGFDSTKQHAKPPNNKALFGDAIWYGLVILLCAVHGILFFGAESADMSEKEPLSFIYEASLNVLTQAYNFYLSFHDITIDHAGNASYWISPGNSST